MSVIKESANLGFSIKIGFPKYLNTLPLLHYLEISPEIELRLKPPKEINRALESGTLVAGLASSLFYAKNYRDYLIIPDISISAVGKVKSVILFHEGPLSTLHKKIIGITPETETSLALLRIILEDFYNIKPQYEILEEGWANLSGSKKETLKGYLAIGDEALLLQKKRPFDQATDLAEIWLKKTNLPFIFALLILRRERSYSPEIREKLKAFILRLYQARAKGVSTLKILLKNSSLQIEPKQALSYLQHLEYDFSGLKQRAFLKFCSFLQKRGIISKLPKLQFFDL
ncbi:MAG: menaquinone biosynthesis protein [Caldimicrobium sp.]|nr:menaquinone biosynthesis protein [Caldimicrobium sp.]MCX7873086.1 menaquinone biosynthesis protein [Caldimicrobium sp.]MDW8094511.1 menaquinone biosynthesis protein [Caldimicrobium sp.]